MSSRTPRSGGGILLTEGPRAEGRDKNVIPNAAQRRRDPPQLRCPRLVHRRHNALQHWELARVETGPSHGLAGLGRDGLRLASSKLRRARSSRPGDGHLVRGVGFVSISQHEVQRHPLWHDAILLAGKKLETRPPSKNGGFAITVLAVCVVVGFCGAVYWLMT